MRRSVLLLASALGVVSARPACADEGLVYRDAVIASDTTWSGTVTLVGPLVVRKGATLTILPGTQVRFVRVDANGDGIGDGELDVEGRLVARGAPGRWISFSSAAADPRPKDWTYVMLDRNRDSVVERCIFEHAFTGLQVHFSTAVVRNNRFRGNFEALRFSTADVVIERNDITDNTYGIRYESRGSAAVVRANRIVGNDYGFFPVVKSSSSVQVVGNHVENRGYNVKLGAEQREDLDFRGNWWGTAEAGRIEAGLFDRRREPALGEVLYRPFLETPVEAVGAQEE